MTELALAPADVPTAVVPALIAALAAAFVACAAVNPRMLSIKETMFFPKSKADFRLLAIATPVLIPFKATAMVTRAVATFRIVLGSSPLTKLANELAICETKFTILPAASPMVSHGIAFANLLARSSAASDKSLNACPALSSAPVFLKASKAV